MTDDQQTVTELALDFGETVYTEDGKPLGRVRGFDEDGFYVTSAGGVEAASADHASTGLSGEGELMWRCWNCGEMGEIENIPDECSSCGAPKEDIYYWTED